MAGFESAKLPSASPKSASSSSDFDFGITDPGLSSSPPRVGGVSSSPVGLTDLSRPGAGGFDGFGGFGGSFFSSGIGRGQTNAPVDVFKGSSFLTDNGYLNAPTHKADEGLFKGIEAFQADANKLAGSSLAVDGVINPFGPTEVIAQRGISGGHFQGQGPQVTDALKGLPNQGRASVFDPQSAREQALAQANQPATGLLNVRDSAQTGNTTASLSGGLAALGENGDSGEAARALEIRNANLKARQDARAASRTASSPIPKAPRLDTKSLRQKIMQSKLQPGDLTNRPVPKLSQTPLKPVVATATSTKQHSFKTPAPAVQAF